MGTVHLCKHASIICKHANYEKAQIFRLGDHSTPIDQNPMGEDVIGKKKLVDWRKKERKKEERKKKERRKVGI